MEVKFVRPNANLVGAIARDMREADVNEIWASSRSTPIQALIKGWKVSNYSVVVTIDKRPCVMLGLFIRDVLSGVGVPWLLGTNESLSYKRQFMLASPPVIDEMLKHCEMLYNWVHSENLESIRWLDRLGFTIDEPEKYGHSGELFHKFHMKR